MKNHPPHQYPRVSFMALLLLWILCNIRMAMAEYTKWEESLYYSQAGNVLRDVVNGKYSSVYVKYHGCVWSEYNPDNGDGDRDEGGVCANGLSSDSFWFLGNTPCFRANVAFSLYGIPSDDGDTKKEPRRKCSGKTFINSFFTTGGLESFGDSVGVNYNNHGVSSSQCTYSSSSGDDYIFYELEEEGDGEGSYYVEHQNMIFPEYTSFGLGCSDGKFVSAKFRGAFCDGTNFLQQKNDLGGLNSELHTVDCKMIYSSQGNFNNNNNDNDGGGGYDAINYLLSNAEACSRDLYRDRCPNPYGMKDKVEKQFRRDSKVQYKSVPWVFPLLITFFLSCSVYLCVLTRRYQLRQVACDRDGLLRDDVSEAPPISERSHRSERSQGSDRRLASLTRFASEKSHDADRRHGSAGRQGSDRRLALAKSHSSDGRNGSERSHRSKRSKGGRRRNNDD